MLDRPWVVLSIAALALFTWWAIGSRTSDHKVRAAFNSAVSISPGLDVQVDGVDVGKIGKVEFEDGKAMVEIGVDDDAWPLHRGTTATLRFGTTLGNGTRRIDLEPGPKTAQEIPDNGIISTRDTVTPVEFDEVFNTFDDKTRAGFQGTFRNGARNLEGRDGDLREGIRRLAPAVETSGSLFEDVASDEAALNKLVVSGHKATRTLAAKRPVISDLVSVMSQTFDTFARNTDGIRQSLDQFAPTLRDTRTTLKRTDTSVDVLDGLVADLRPGLAAFEPLLETAKPASKNLDELVPATTDTVRQLRKSSPPVTSFLDQGVPFAEKADPVLSKLAEQLKCVRPYAPEIAGFFSNWSSWGQGYDNDAHYGRIKVVTGATFVTSYPQIKTNDFLKTVGTGLNYAMPRPPGLNAGQPWFVPECGAGPEALDPSKDPEDK
ncbi:MlaD family protein [Conexibacter sp. SYSU D00693]|uniref:MlaD family protein n=1 Tax=Conexibacter sp. SYSU D00693 TaxID=2812560 RepID=UPI00196AD258|nr:MlaD family protein [Conexibacter sp. SYSU D00693]